MSDEKYQAISKAVTEGEDIQTGELVKAALDASLPPLEILQKGVVDGITKAGELWKANQYFLPDVILSADAFKVGMEVLDPELKNTQTGPSRGKYIIGVVEGDMHDLGKSLVVALLTSAGFEVVDLGIDVPMDKFVEAVKTHQPTIVGLGAYMTTTMLIMKDIIKELSNQGLRNNVKVMVGGVPTSQEFSDEVGADAWGRDALDAMQKALTLVGG
ncbi:MAG: corrinoid protein [Anaerolineales bacterium]|nr:corrinoid protein [Anaerolineales bacterium]